MIIDNGNQVIKYWNQKNRKGGKTGLGRDFKDFKTTVMVKWEIFFSAWGTRKTVINAQAPWSGYPPQWLHEELSDAAWVQKVSWSIAEALWCIKTAQVNSRSGCKGGSSLGECDLHRGFSLPSSSEGNQQLRQPRTFPKRLTYNCDTCWLLCPLPLCVSPGTKREQTEKQIKHFCRILLRYDLRMNIFINKKKEKK